MGKNFFVFFINGRIGIFEDEKGNKKEIEFIEGKINRNYQPKK